MHTRASHSTGTTQQDRHGWSRWHMTWSIAIVAALGLALAGPSPVQAKTFHCGTGDVRCLIAALTDANANQDGQNAIRLEAGTYTLVDVDNTIDGPNGLPSITRNLTITGAGADLTIIERNNNAAPFRLIHVAATGSLTLDGLTLRGGRLDFLCGIGLHTAGGRVTISHSAIVNNSGVASSGGGLCVQGGATVTITASTISENFISFGPSGGGLYIDRGATVTIMASTIGYNGVDFSAGGLYIASGATVTIMDTAIVGNGAILVGGIENAGTLTIINSTVAQNGAGQGSYSAILSSGPARILNSTFAENWLSDISRGGVVLVGNITLQNTILAHNTSNGQPSDCSHGVSLGNNLFGDVAGCFDFIFQTVLLPSDLRGDPGLGPYTDDETPGDGHFPLLSTSQAINAGNPAVCPKTDQLEEQRDKLCDIGAIEFQGKVMSSR